MPPQVTNATMINHVIDWITGQTFYTKNQQPNYAVGITKNYYMIISKAGGVSSKTDGMNALADDVMHQPWWPDLEGLYFAGTFGGDGGSNHGEMCILAAADELREPVVDMRCTGDNCPACHATLIHAGVNTMNKAATGAQSGWIHPRGRMALGSQLNSDWQGQLDELRAFNKLTPAEQEDFTYKLTQRAGRDPKGKSEAFV